jgi:hypothetical protein
LTAVKTNKRLTCCTNTISYKDNIFSIFFLHPLSASPLCLVNFTKSSLKFLHPPLILLLRKKQIHYPTHHRFSSNTHLGSLTMPTYSYLITNSYSDCIKPSSNRLTSPIFWERLNLAVPLHKAQFPLSPSLVTISRELFYTPSSFCNIILKHSPLAKTVG